jgi:hypothetical protein
LLAHRDKPKALKNLFSQNVTVDDMTGKELLDYPLRLFLQHIGGLYDEHAIRLGAHSCLFGKAGIFPGHALTLFS